MNGTHLKISGHLQRRRPPVALGRLLSTGRHTGNCCTDGDHSLRSKPVIRVHPLLYTSVYNKYMCRLFIFHIQAQFHTDPFSVASVIWIILRNRKKLGKFKHCVWKCKGAGTINWTPGPGFDKIPPEGFGRQRPKSNCWDYWNTNDHLGK